MRDTAFTVYGGRKELCKRNTHTPPPPPRLLQECCDGRPVPVGLRGNGRVAVLEQSLQLVVAGEGGAVGLLNVRARALEVVQEGVDYLLSGGAFVCAWQYSKQPGWRWGG